MILVTVRAATMNIIPIAVADQECLSALVDILEESRLVARYTVSDFFTHNWMVPEYLQSSYKKWSTDIYDIKKEG